MLSEEKFKELQDAYFKERDLRYEIMEKQKNMEILKYQLRLLKEDNNYVDIINDLAIYINTSTSDGHDTLDTEEHHYILPKEIAIYVLEKFIEDKEK